MMLVHGIGLVAGWQRYLTSRLPVLYCTPTCISWPKKKKFPNHTNGNLNKCQRYIQLIMHKARDKKYSIHILMAAKISKISALYVLYPYY